MEATIRIQTERAGQPRGGLAGALGGGLEPGDSQSVEVDLREATGGDVAVNLPAVAEAYRKAFSPTPGAPIVITVPDELTERVRVHDAPNGAVVMPESAQVIPFPEAGDPHPFERTEGTAGDPAEAAYDAIHEVLITAPAREATRLTTERIMKALRVRGMIG